MPNFIVSTATTTVRTIASTEAGIITAAGSIVGFFPVAVTMSGGRLIMAGTVFADDAAIDVNAGSGGFASVSIASTGIAASSADGMTLDGLGRIALSNAGLISAQNYGVTTTVRTALIDNSGDIVGQLGVGVRAIGTETFSLSNSGRITGNSVSFSGISLDNNINCDVTNGGLISGGLGMIIESTNAVLVNSGTITGASGAGIEAETTGSFKLTNTGSISGGGGGVVLTALGVCNIVNTGVISGGGAGSLSLGDGDCFVRNSGTLTNDIDLGGGVDTFFGQGGIQFFITAGAGADYVAGGAMDEYFDMGSGNDAAFGGSGDDSIEGYAGLDTLHGGQGDDSLNGVEDDDQLFGGAGDDTLIGDLGVDILRGGGGHDSLSGGAGKDSLHGNAGDDTMTGGAAVDVFIFGRGNGADEITDFANDIDKLDLRVLGYANLAALAADGDDTSLGLLFDFTSHGGGSLLVSGLTLATLTAVDVLI